MSALVPGYNHDIFISYRGIDNRDGWITAFVEQLKSRFECRFAQSLDIYLDHNSLHDNHYVDASIKHHLKSFILIPIVSPNYCKDRESYAWRNEFLAFKQQAFHEELGLEVVHHGNVSSRILPVRIYDLKPAEIQPLEDELDGHLRSINFFCSSPNRPLYPDDVLTEHNRTLYRDQLGAVIDAVNELLQAVKQRSAPPSPKAPIVFLPWTSPSLVYRREELAVQYRRAGFEVRPANDCPTDEADFRQQTAAALAASTCTVHLLGSDFGQCFEQDVTMSFARYAYRLANMRLSQDPTFRQIICFCVGSKDVVRVNQQHFINEVRQNPTIERCEFFTVPMGTSFISVINHLSNRLKAADDLPPSSPPPARLFDIFFTFNALDAREAKAITKSLSGRFLDLAITPDSREDYRKLTAEAIARSRLAVVYFKNSLPWALTFVDQLWGLAGGATSRTPILLVGEDEPEINKRLGLRMDHLTFKVLSHEQISAEVHRRLAELNA